MFLSIIFMIAMFISAFIPNFIAAKRNIKSHQFVAYISLLNLGVFFISICYFSALISIFIMVVLSLVLSTYCYRTKNIIVPESVLPPHKTDSTGLIVTLSVLKNNEPPFKASSESIFFEDEERGKAFAKANEQYLIGINKVYIGK